MAWKARAGLHPAGKGRAPSALRHPQVSVH